MAAHLSWNPEVFPPRGGQCGLLRWLAPLAALLLSATVQGAEGAGANPQGATPRDDVTNGEAIEELEVEPADYPPAVLMPNARVPQAPAATAASVREQWWAAQQRPTQQRPAGAAGPAAAAPVTISLGPGATSAPGTAYLVLTRPQSVHPETTVEFAADAGGIAAVKLMVEDGQSYLLDFAVSGLGPGVYDLAADSAHRAFEDPHGTRRHLMITLKAKASGWTTVRLSRSGTGFHLHSVDVTGAM